MISLTNLTARSAVLENEIARLEKEALISPKDSLITRKLPSGNYSYYKRICLPGQKPKEIYLGNGQRDEARQLATAMFNHEKLLDLKKEKKLIDFLILQRNEETYSDAFLRKHPGIIPLLSSQVVLDDKNAADWKNAPYFRNFNYPDQIKYSTIVPDILTRSKSEANILARLEHYCIPYHYDEIININGSPVAIDFICLNVRSHLFWYWDHRGMMDDPGYFNKTMRNDALFYQAGIIPWINMIVTAETKKHPLDIQWVDHLIQYYLL